MIDIVDIYAETANAHAHGPYRHRVPENIIHPCQLERHDFPCAAGLHATIGRRRYNESRWLESRTSFFETSEGGDTVAIRSFLATIIPTIYTGYLTHTQSLEIPDSPLSH